MQAVCTYRSPKHDRPIIDIDYSTDCKYWIISIRCRDRNKLLFDTGGPPGCATLGCALAAGGDGINLLM